MKIKVIVTLFVSMLLLVGCGEPSAPTANKDVSKRPSISYQVDKYKKLPLKYPLKVGVLQLRDLRIMPFYGKENFFQEEDIKGLSKMAYLELKASKLFNSVKYINESAPFNLDQGYLTHLMKKYDVDVIFVGDLTSFTLLRKWKGNSGNFSSGPVGTSFTVSVDMSILGQLIYLDGAALIWNGKLSRKNKLLVTSEEVSVTQLGALARETQQQIFSDLSAHISKNGKRMIIR